MLGYFINRFSALDYMDELVIIIMMVGLVMIYVCYRTIVGMKPPKSPPIKPIGANPGIEYDAVTG